MIAAGVRFDHAGVDCETLAAHQPRLHAGAHDLLENTAEKIALAKTSMAVFREGRMIGNRAFKTKATEPAIGEIEINFLAQPPLRPDAEAVADQQHPDHQLGVDRGASGRGIIAFEGFSGRAKIKNRIDHAQQMIARNMAFEPKLIKQTRRFVLTPHHRNSPNAKHPKRRNHACKPQSSRVFQQHPVSMPMLQGDQASENRLPQQFVTQ